MREGVEHPQEEYEMWDAIVPPATTPRNIMCRLGWHQWRPAVVSVPPQGRCKEPCRWCDGKVKQCKRCGRQQDWPAWEVRP